jgi:hypothetical protein
MKEPPLEGFLPRKRWEVWLMKGAGGGNKAAGLKAFTASSDDLEMCPLFEDSLHLTLLHDRQAKLLCVGTQVVNDLIPPRIVIG